LGSFDLDQVAPSIVESIQISVRYSDMELAVKRRPAKGAVLDPLVFTWNTGTN